MDFRMAQNYRDRDRSRDWICIQTSKWPKTDVTEIGHVTGYGFKFQNGLFFPFCFGLFYCTVLTAQFVTSVPSVLLYVFTHRTF